MTPTIEAEQRSCLNTMHVDSAYSIHRHEGYYIFITAIIGCAVRCKILSLQNNHVKLYRAIRDNSESRAAWLCRVIAASRVGSTILNEISKFMIYEQRS